MPRGRSDICLVRGVAVGQAEAPDLASGVTVITFDRGAPTVVDVRGGASATYDTASLSLDATFGRRWAIFLSGGSLYGLDAARGVRTRLLETGAGVPAFRRGAIVVPISGAALYDLGSGTSPLPDYLALGYEATRQASRRPVRVGPAGAGSGATVGKYLGRAHAMPGGIGSAGARVAGGGHVGVLVAVNSVGAIRDPGSGEWVAGARSARGRVAPPDRPRPRTAARGTTLAVVATDLPVGRPALARIAAIVHAGLGRVIVPYLTATDGDLVFATSTAAEGARVVDGLPGEIADRVGALAADLAGAAVLQAVRAGTAAVDEN